jgi:hypothetical protein
MIEICEVYTPLFNDDSEQLCEEDPTVRRVQYHIEKLESMKTCLCTVNDIIAPEDDPKAPEISALECRMSKN